MSAKLLSRHMLAVALIIMLLIGAASPSRLSHAQDSTNSDLVASLETLTPGVSIKRVNTDAWVLVQHESLVGVGDSVKTDGNGKARITFFADGTDTEVQPNSEFRIDAFSGSDAQYQLSVTVLVGQTTQRIAKLLDSGSSYTINSTGLELTVRGTVLAVRVEPSGRSSTIVQTGAVQTKNMGGGTFKDPTRAQNLVPAGYGVRAEPGKGLSDVVPAANFVQLDAQLDGCESLIQTLGDVQLNVRIGPGLNFTRVGLLSDKIRQHILGVTQTSHWYRIAYKGGYAWLFSPALKLDATCAGLRVYPDTSGAEDPALYSGLDSDIDPAALPTFVPPTPSVATQAATQAP